ncbi:MAG: hypothetical protein AB1489_08585 [Acidobacteriota bacterium]
MNEQVNSLDVLIANYMEEHATLLERAASGQLFRLLENFLALADLYAVLERLATIQGRTLEVVSPLLILDRTALVALGYNNQQLARIDRFLAWVYYKTHQDFRALVAARLCWHTQRAA